MKNMSILMKISNNTFYKFVNRNTFMNKDKLLFENFCYTFEDQIDEVRVKTKSNVSWEY